MSDDNGAGNGGQGQQNNDGGAQNQGGDGKNQGTGGAGSASAGTGSGSGTQGSDKAFTQADVDRIIADRLGRAKEKFDADLAAAKDSATKPLQEQLNELRKSLSDRDVRDVERNGRLAMSAVQTLLAERGIPKKDVEEVLDGIDPKKKLLKDGEPDEEAIAKFANGLARVAGRATFDPDQGQNGSGEQPQTMADFMRHMARNRR
ncbi:hypothetical protein ACWEOE_28950 [Amycolatopsis sp. NPDC004368]